MERMFKLGMRTLGVVVLFTAILLATLPKEASAALTGNWGCLGTTTFSCVAKGTTQPQTVTESQMMRLVVSSAGIVSATILLGESGAEICQFTAKGTISVNAMGFGSLSLTFNPNIPDEDKDATFNCSAFYGRTATHCSRQAETNPIKSDYTSSSAGIWHITSSTLSTSN